MAATRTRTRSGGVSIVRISLTIGIVGILIVGAWLVWFFIDQASRQVPFEVAIYPGAEYWGETNVLPGSRDLFYRTPDTPEQVSAYYTQKMSEYYGNGDQVCVRLPPEGTNAGAEANLNSVLYQFKCMFDRSGFNSTQYTQIVIYPGRYNADPFLNAEGLTIVKYEQQWQQ